MSIFDDQDSPKAPVGGISSLKQLKGAVPQTQSGASSDDLWRKMWSARGGFNFVVPKGGEREVILLTDVSVFLACPILFGWVEKGHSFPKFEYVRSPGFDDDGNPLMDSCPISEVTLMHPTIVGAAAVLDLNPFVDKDGKEHKYSFKTVLIKSDAVLNSLLTMSRHHGRSLQMAKIAIRRSDGDKSPNTGDSWFCTGFMEEDKLIAKVPEYKTMMEKIDMNVGYLRPNAEETKALLMHHVAQCKKHQAKNNKVTNYDTEAWARYTAEPKASLFNENDIMTTASNVVKGADKPVEIHLVGETDGTAFDLSDLDDRLA